MYNAKINNIEDKIPDITNLASITTLNSKTNKIKNKTHNISDLARIATLTVLTTTCS